MFFTILRLFNLITSSGSGAGIFNHVCATQNLGHGDGTTCQNQITTLFLRATRAESLSSSTVRYSGYSGGPGSNLCPIRGYPDRSLVVSSTVSYQRLTLSRFMNISPPHPTNFYLQLAPFKTI
jgi:hypothetical protein